MTYHHRTFPEPPPSHPPQRQDHREPHRRQGDLDALRTGYRRLRRISTLTALGYFTLFLLLAAFTPGLMTSEVTGGLNTGLMLGLCQLPVALAAIALYERIARRRIDPLATAIRERAEQASTGGARS
ncbi:DUF485 domain-containing protein [Streptomyces sp. NPDC049837]|uniref:DUF485 domain-containing protein n=1 Tax=Streptomyces sp. NPDC049837 TaxID=3155277 RepID=UPI0034489EAC